MHVDWENFSSGLFIICLAGGCICVLVLILVAIHQFIKDSNKNYRKHFGLFLIDTLKFSLLILAIGVTVKYLFFPDKVIAGPSGTTIEMHDLTVIGNPDRKEAVLTWRDNSTGFGGHIAGGYKLPGKLEK